MKFRIILQFFIIAALIAVAAADSAYPAPAYPAPAYNAPAYSTPKYDYVSTSETQSPQNWITRTFPFDSELQPAQPYNFAYAVEDVPSYNSFGHQETSDGKTVTGSYRVALPDGRTQIVTYKVDGYSGFVADVKYEGVAKYPEYSAPAYKAAPAYPAPAYPAKY